MLNKIIEFAIKNKLIVGLFVVFLIAFGSYQFTKLPIDAVPDITNNQVQVITVAPSFGATDIERLVTFPIEQANSNIAGMKEIRSFSRFGLSLVTIVFDDDIDIYWARQQVAERLQKVQNEIPKGIGTPQLGPITTGLGEIYQYVVKEKKGSQKKYTILELRTIQDWIIRRQLLGVKNVAEVSSFGGKLKQYSVEIDPNKLQANNISIGDVFTALENNNQNTGGAYIEKGGTVLYIRSEGILKNTEDIENTFIKTTQSGNPLFIRDVADIKIGNATRFGALTYNDEGEVAGGIVMMLKGANSNDVIENVKASVAEIQKILPEGVEIEPFLDRTKMVNNAISTVAKNLAEGALIVIFVLVLFLGNFRAGLLVASVIPLAMLFAIILMNIFGVSGNLMSLGALDFGLIIDGAVIIVESVMHLLVNNKNYKNTSLLNQSQMNETVKHSASKMMNSAVFGQIIILIVYLPIFSLQGIEGKMFKPMAQTVAFALLGAFILSLTYIPMMSSLVLSKKTEHKKNISDRMMAWLENGYHKGLQRALMMRKLILTITISLFALAIIVLSFMGGEFIPTLEEGDFAVETRVLVGSNLTTTIEATQKAAHILKTRFPEVEKVVGKIGSGEVPTDPMPMEACDLMVILKNKSEWTSAKTFDELAEKMSTALQDVPGITNSFQYPVQMRFNELMTGAKQDVVCKIFGENLDSLAFYANKLGNLIPNIEGAKNLYVEAIEGLPQVIIEYNRNAMAQYNMNIADVNKTVNAALAGQQSGYIFEGEKRFDLVVRVASSQKKDITDIRNLLIASPSGAQIPLYQLADVSLKESVNQIQREDAKRRIIVGFNVRGRDVASIVKELQGKAAKEIKLPAGYFIQYGGAFENMNAAKNRLVIAVPISLLLIFLLLFFAFKSIKHSLLIFTAIPLSAIGGILLLALRGMPFSISAGIGFIALFGVAVLNGIVLIAEFNRLKNDGETDLHKIVLEGSKLRLRPVLMTAFVASLGFFPMALSNGAGAEVQRPLATVVIGGLLVATFLTLFVLPILYILFEKINLKNNRMKFEKISVLLMLICGFSQANAQQKIGLKAAIDSALSNNLQLKSEQLKSKYQDLLIASGGNLSATNIGVDYGQMNSAYYDNKISVSQSFNLPTVYHRQKQMLKEDAKSVFLSVAVKESVLKRQVEQSFYNILYLLEKEKLLANLDSLFSAFQQRAKLRLEKGETNILEKAIADNQLAQIKTQHSQLTSDLAIAQIQFALLLNTKEMFLPEAAMLKMATANQSEQRQIENHPSILWSKQQKSIAHSSLRMEQSKLLPSFSFGVNNTTIKGFGADEIFYSTSTRFTAAQLGFALPIFRAAQKAKIRAARFGEIIAENEYQSTLQAISAELLTANVAYKNSTENVDYLEKQSLPNAKIIKQVAQQQLENGAINYLEWVQLIHQSTSIENDYLDAIKKLNEAIIQLHFLNN